MIAPDPSPTLTETPALTLRTRGMNSRNEWTVFRETMSFYGVAHDRLPRVVVDRETAVRATVSTSFVPAGADRRIGVWCVPPVTSPAWRNRNLKRTRSPKAASVSSLLAGTRYSKASTWAPTWITSNWRIHGGKSRKPEKNETRNIRSLDM